jgi:hypothetical protein
MQTRYLCVHCISHGAQPMRNVLLLSAAVQWQQLLFVLIDNCPLFIDHARCALPVALQQ